MGYTPGMPVRWIQRDGIAPYLAPVPILPREVEAIRSVAPVRLVGGSGTKQPKPSSIRETYAPESPSPMERKPALLASQIMTPHPVTITEDRPLSETGALLRQHGFRHLPVVTHQGALTGMISERDLLRGLPGGREGPMLPPWEIRQVGDLMSRRLLTATPDTPLREIARVMVAERIGCLPILDQERLLVGILTSTDLMRCIVNEAPLDLWI